MLTVVMSMRVVFVSCIVVGAWWPFSIVAVWPVAVATAAAVSIVDIGGGLMLVDGMV